MRYNPLVFMIALIGCLLNACATGPPQSHPHLMVDPDGYALEDDGERMSPDAYDERIQNIIEDVLSHVKSVRSLNKKVHLLVHIHGGLVSQDESLEFIEEMVKPDGLLKDTDYYPVFINWDASLLSSLYDDIFEVRRGVRDRLMGYLTSPFVALSRILSGIARLPVSIVYQYDTEKMQFENWEGEKRSAVELIGNGIITVASMPVTIVSLPFISGFGEGAWRMLRRRTDQMFAYQIPPHKHNLIDQLHESGALRQFFKAVEHMAQGDRGDVKITLVGHSMGAIVVNKILQAFPNINFDRIIYLAAAASIEDFLNTIPPYLETHTNTRFYSFSLSNKDEGGEFNLFLPRGSLLVWIDNMFEPAISPTGKRVGFFRYRDVIRISPEDEKCCPRMTFIKFTGLLGQPRKHGDFNNDGIYQKILEWASPKAVELMTVEEGFVRHCPCLP